MSKCTKLLIVRHGAYNEDNMHDMHLSDAGKTQLNGLSKKIVAMVGDKKAAILSSTAHCAHESAAIIAERIGCDFEKHEILWSERDHPDNFPGTLDLIRPYLDDTDVLIMVTHYEYVEDFPRYFAKEQLQADIYSHLISKGMMWVLDWSEKPTLTAVGYN